MGRTTAWHRARFAKLPGFSAAEQAVIADKEYLKTPTGRKHGYREPTKRAVAECLKHAPAKEQTRLLEALGLSGGRPYSWSAVRKTLGLAPRVRVPGRVRDQPEMRPVIVGVGNVRPRRPPAVDESNGQALVVTTPEGYHIEGPVALVAELLNSLLK